MVQIIILTKLKESWKNSRNRNCVLTDQVFN